MYIKKQLKRIAEFIYEHGITPLPRERFYGIRDTLFAWLITAITITFFEIPNDLITIEIDFCIKFFAGCLVLFLYVSFESFCNGEKLKGLKSLLIRNYTETTTHEIHLNSWQRTKFIYTRGFIATGSYIALVIAGKLFGVVDNGQLFGADALVYAILGSFVFVRIFKSIEWLGLILASIGVFVILFFDIASLNWKTGLASGIAGILSAIFFCIVFFISSIIVRHDTPIRIAFHQCIAGTLLSLTVFIITIVVQYFWTGNVSIPHLTLDRIRDSILVGVLYGWALVFFLRAFIYTEPIIIAMLGFSVGIFTILFESLYKGIYTNYKTILSSFAITLGCSLLIYQEYIRRRFEESKKINLRPLYQKSLKQDLISIEDDFHTGKVDKYTYLSEKQEFNKLLFEYSRQIENSIIESIEILPNSVRFTILPLNIKLEADGGARSAPFEILNFGSYEPEDEKMAFSLVKDGDVILDVGAHLGWYSINFAMRYKNSKVYAFEPIKNTFDFLTKNIKLNNLTNIFPLHYGLSDSESDKDFYYFPGGSALASVENLISHKNIKKVKAHLKKLDEAIGELNLNAVDFIKCDVEGLEFYMLKGGKGVIEKYKPILLIELYEEWCIKCGYSSEQVIDFLKNMGYEIFQSTDGKLYKIHHEILSSSDRYNYFFLHKNKHSKIIENYSPN